MCVQPCFAFVGEQFESDSDFRLAKSMLLDFFRGRLVESINLKVSSFEDCELLTSSGACLSATKCTNLQVLKAFWPVHCMSWHTALGVLR